MTLLLAVVVGGLTFGAALLVLTTQRRALVRDRLSPYLVDAGPATSKRRTSASWRPTAMAESVLMRLDLYRAVAEHVDRAGLDIGVGTFALLTVGASAVGALFLFAAQGAFWGVVGGVAGGVAPWLVVQVLASRRSRAFERQLPEILDTLAASLRAGHGFDQAMQTVATEVGEPAGREFRKIVSQAQLGRPLDEGLADLGRRIRSADFRFVLDAIMIQRQVGGSLAGLFDLVAETVRAREEFRRRLRALTGMVRMSANVLTFLPLAAAALLTFVNPRYMNPLWHSQAGHIMLAVAVVMVICGGIVLRRIGAVKG